jgi:hypothetical protein
LSCSRILAPLSFCCHEGKHGDHMHTLCIKFSRVFQNKLGLGYLAEVGTHNTTRPHTTHLPPLLSRRSPGNTSVSSPLPPLMVYCPWVIFWSPGMPLPSHSWSAQLSGGGPLFPAACWHTNNQSNTTTVRQHIQKKHIRKKPILPTSTIKMKGGGDVLQGHHIRGRAISCNAFIILHSQRRNW